MQRLARIVFGHFWNTLSLFAAAGEWTVACWTWGPPAHPLAHLLGLAVLFLLNRAATVAYEVEDAVAPLRHRLGAGLLAAGFSCAGAAGGLVVATVTWAVVGRAGGLTAQAGTLAHAPLGWLGPDGVAVGWLGFAAGMGLVVDGFLLGHRRLVTTRLDVTLPHLPPALDGFRVVQVSDLHLGPIAHRAALRQALDRATAEDADLVVVTGDVVDSPHTDPARWLPELRRLRARHGVVAVLGNHDLHVGLDAVADGLRAATDWVVLRDAVHRVDADGGTLWIAGLEFRRAPHDGAAVAALASALPANAPALLLAHHPNAFPAAVDTGLFLTLAGHTHGGQVTVPLAPRWNPARLLMTPYDAGTFVEDGCVLHVNRGLGTSGQRLRIGAPREITVVTLRAPRATAAG